MPPFLTSWSKETPVLVSRKQVFFTVCFRLSEGLKDSVAYEDIATLECDILMGFYCDPVPGDFIDYNGIKWLITARQHRPTRRGKQEQKWIAEVLVEAIGKADELSDLIRAQKTDDGPN